MLSADTNIFIYAADLDSDFNIAARKFLEKNAHNKDFVLSEPVLLEIYMNLRKPAIFKKPKTSFEAYDYCESLRRNPYWSFVDYNPMVRDKVWGFLRDNNPAYHRAIDARMAFSLIHAGVTQFATVNTKDFQDFGFQKIWNPLI